MGSFHAELHVASHVFALLHCTYGVHQVTDARGRPITRVRYEGPRLWLDVPDTPFLEH